MTTTTKFPLVDGRCPVCDTVVEHEVDGVRVRFMPHDDPDWCRQAAMFNARMLRRALEQGNEDRAFAQHREAFYRHAFAIALRELAENVSSYGGSLDPDEWRESIERRVREETQSANERSREHLLRERCDLANRKLFGDDTDGDQR